MGVFTKSMLCVVFILLTACPPIFWSGSTIYANENYEGYIPGSPLPVQKNNPNLNPTNDGTGDVSLYSGAFVYNVPIVVPPGIDNMQTDLSLIYNSGGSNGWCGIGWDLSLGSIRRDTKDGIPTYDDSKDTFIFTFRGINQELVPIDSGPYGEYRTQIESDFMKFYYDGNTKAWTVWDKSGTRYLLGSTADSRLTNYPDNDKTFMWAMDKIIDTNSNYITINYNKDIQNYTAFPLGNLPDVTFTSKQLYPDYIEYTGNENTGFSPKFKVEFELESRDDILTNLKAGFPIITAQRLKNIKITMENAKVRRYELNYSQNHLDESLLTSVAQYGDNDSSYLPATEFTYQEPIGNIGESKDWGGIGKPGPQSRYTYNDFNGDGRTDIACYQPLYPERNYAAYGVSIALSTGASFDLNAWTGTGGGYFYDFNGDGKTDMAIPIEGDLWHMKGLKVGLSDGTKFVDSEIWNSDIEIGRGDFIFGDFNGDGKFDVGTYAEESQDGYPIRGLKIWFSTGSKFIDSNPEKINVWTLVAPGPSGFRFADFNGDGLTDAAIYAEHTEDRKHGLIVLLSTGKEFLPPEEWLYRGVATRSNFFLADYNGDGMTDVGAYSTENPASGYKEGFKIWISNGKKLIYTGEWIQSGSLQHFLVADFNGDGKTDVGYYTPTYVGPGHDPSAPPDFKVHLSKGNNFYHEVWSNLAPNPTQTYILGDFDGDKMADICVDYYDPLVHPELEVALARGPSYQSSLIKIKKTLGGTIDISYGSSAQFENTQLPFAVQVTTQTITNNGLGNEVKTKYDYARGYYDFETREFLGFGEVKSTDAEGNYKINYFLQNDFPYRYNKGKDSVNICQGKLYKQQHYEEILLREEKTSWSYSNPYGDNIPVFFPLIWYIQKTDITTSGTKTNRVEYQYGDYGNIIKISNLGDVDKTGDERYDVIQYTENSSAYIVNLPSRKATSDYTNSTLTQTLYYYDNSSNINSEPTKGNLTKKEEWLDKENRYLPTNIQYDGYGNMTKVIDPRGNTTGTTYDSIYHTYPEQITNPKGHIYKYIYNPKFGTPEEETDPNNVTTYYRYDEFGRLKKSIGPYDTESQPTTEYVYNLTGTAPNQTIAYQRINHGEPAVLDIHTFTDGLGRTIKTEKPGPDGKKIISDEVSFNNRGLVEKRYLPYFANSSSAGYSVTTYDALGRVIRIDNPDGTYTRTTYYTWAEEQYDENGNKHKYTRDAYNRIIKVEEYKDNQTYTTTYDYDALGRLTKIVNSLSAAETTTISYDSLDRKTQMIDPKMGTWKYKYDDNGNLTSQQDNKNQTILMSYDVMNRIQTKTYPQGVGITYQYDNPTKPNCMSRLDYVDDASGRTSFEYDKLGQITKTIKKLGTNEYTTEFTYNAMGQQTNIRYPDEEHELVNYTYNNGFLESVHSSINYINDIDYQATGQIANLTYGNGVTTQYNYNPQNLRLTTLKTYNTKGTIQQFSYTYDNTGNITNVLDAENSSTQAFGYDDLNRLQQAVGIGTYAQRYQYDSVGNITMALPSTKRVPEDYPTIQQAIEASKAGDVINVSPDTYTENITLKQGVIVQSTDGPASTIIQGTGGPVVTATNQETQTTILRGFTITGGTGEHPGIYCKDSSPSIIHNIIKNNIGNASMSTGGGISLYNSSALVMYNTIQENKAEYGGGIFCDNEDNPNAEAVKIYQNKISSNTATSDYYNLAGAGGGVYVHQANAKVVDNIITGNTGQFGGGIYVYGSYDYSIEPVITDNKIKQNSANFGGGIFCDNNVKPQITGNIISKNTAILSQTENPMGGGGGIYTHQSDPVIDNNTIADNGAAFFGGGIYAYNSSVQITHNKLNNNSTDPDYGGFGGGMFFDAGTSASVQDNQINFNKSPSGAGIYSNSSTIDIVNNKIMYNNSTGYGAGMYCSDSSVNITNNQLTNNTAGGDGAGIWCVNNTGGRIINNVVSYNTARLFGGGVYISGALSLDFANNIVSDNNLTRPADGAGQEIFVSPPFELPTAYNNIYYGLSPQYSAYYGWQPNPSTGDVGVDPKFLNPEGGDYHLRDGSLCINWGDPNPSYNDPPVYSNPVDLRNDMGNYGGPLAKVVLRADAGYDQVVISSSTVILDGTWSSYPNGIDSFSSQWEQIEGSTVPITNPTSLEASFTPTQEGLYVFKLTITADASSDTDEVAVWVEDEFIHPYTTTTFETQTYNDIEYDANGNMVKIGGRQISYDYENRPKTIVMPTEEGKIITYTYDYTGQRVKKEVRDKDRAEQALTGLAEKLEELGFSQFSRIFERFILQRASRPSPPQPAPRRGGSPPQPNPPSPSQESEVTYYIGNLYEMDSSSTTTVTTKYIYANGQRIAKSWTRQSSSGGGSKNIQYYHSDHLGSSNVITDSSGNKVQLLEYVPFGTTRTEQGTATVDYRFTGQMLDNDAGLYYYMARWYEPVVGKFITPDTIIQAPYDPQSLNRYAYARNNPVKYVDPSGYQFEGIISEIFQYVEGYESGYRDKDVNLTKQSYEYQVGFLQGQSASVSKESGTLAKIARTLSLDPERVTDIAEGNWEKIWGEIRNELAQEPKNLSELTQEELNRMMYLVIGFSSPMNIKGKTFSRFMVKKELKEVRRTGLLRGGEKGKTYFTTHKFRKASSAKSKLSLDTTPEVRVDFRIKNNPNVKTPGRTAGGGIQFYSNGPVEAEIIRLRKLK